MPESSISTQPRRPARPARRPSPKRGLARRSWAGTVDIHPHAKTGAHHHGPVESVIYIVRGRARMGWGERLEFMAEAGPGDFIYIPPFVPHQEINASDEELSCVVVRSGQEAVVINVELECAPVVGRDQAAPLTGVRALRFSNWTGLR